MSLEQLYRKVNGKGPTILAVKSLSNEVFGAFASESWRKSNKKYFGTGEDFLFTSIYPDDAKAGCGGLSLYKWSKKNDYFQLGMEESLSLGGGGGVFGLSLDSTFSKCSTGSCLTFDNKPLTSISPFEAMRVEVWGFISRVEESSMGAGGGVQESKASS